VFQRELFGYDVGRWRGLGGHIRLERLDCREEVGYEGINRNGGLGYCRSCSQGFNLAYSLEYRSNISYQEESCR
jgi:hypothetical protein